MAKAAVFGVVENGVSNINKRYFEHIHQSGVDTFVPYPENADKTARDCDCLVVCGGGDMNPAFYGQKPWKDNLKFNTDLDKYELELIEAFIKRKKPVLGICKGMQSINTALGGTLIQDIPSMLNLCHSNCGATECMHEIKISARSKLKEALGLRAIVNSYHHQCVHLTGSGLTVAAASHDGVIEAIEGTELPLLGTQWHPERMAGNAVFDHFFGTYL